MPEIPSASLAWIPPNADHDELVLAAQRCQGCDLYKNATQAVLGEGPAPAPMMLVGETPGDQEDRTGRPFVGPAGRVLDEALEEAEIPRDRVYVTNAVKHFKWEPRGKRRLHAKPSPEEVHACRGWLEAEMALVRPEIVVCLGATASQALLGKAFQLTHGRGTLRDGAPWSRHILATYHPSALLRVRDDEERYARLFAELVADLAEAASVVTFGRQQVSRLRARPSAPR